MPDIVRDLPALTPSSSGSTSSSAIGCLDDALSLHFFMASSANSNTTSCTIQVSQFDPMDTKQQTGVSSTSWYVLSTLAGAVTSSVSTVSITNIGFRGLRFSLQTSNKGEIIAYASKQIRV